MAPIKLKLFGIQISSNDGCPFTPTPQEEVSVVVAMSPVDRNLEKEESMGMSTVPCPRCNSPNTKFCYFNNYSTNQPRHFCKDCQRYWTAGGALRNLPQGSGCRKKTKPTLSTISETAVSAEFLKSSPTTVVPPNNQSLPKHTIRLPPPPSSREALLKVSNNECLGTSEPSQEPIDPSLFCFPVGPCPNIGYGFEGKGGHETIPWTTPPCSPITKAPLLGKHPRERSETAETDSSTCSIAKMSRIRGPQEATWSSISSTGLVSEENRPNSLVSTTGTIGIFSGFPLKFEEPFVQALNGDPAAATHRSISFQQGSGNSRPTL